MHDGHAEDYDCLAEHYLWRGHEILFGMAYDATAAPARLLDVGIGTGMGSQLFARAGWQVWGFDGGAKLLAQCAQKGFAVDLRQWDLRNTPWPYDDRAFQGVVCCGVLHFLDDLAAFFQEAARLIAPGGFCAFTTKPLGTGDDVAWKEVLVEGATVYEHSRAYVRGLLHRVGLEETKWQPFHAGALDQDPHVFVAHVARPKASGFSPI
jgi:predicted TPR repeat methyltransferase